MHDILKEREKRTRKALNALQKIIQILIEEEFLGPGVPKVEMDWENRLARITIPVEVEDFYIWDEILHDPS